MQTAKVNVAKQSTAGHFVEKAGNVINLDETREIYLVEGESILTTKNHTTLKMKEDCLIIPQQVYNPLSKLFQRSID